MSMTTEEIERRIEELNDFGMHVAAKALSRELGASAARTTDLARRDPVSPGSRLPGLRWIKDATGS